MTKQKYAITGADGFLGWHTRAAMLEDGIVARPFAVGDSFDEDRAAEAMEGADVLLHLAGVNRGDQVESGNILFARQVADVLKRLENPPSKVVYANSIQAGNGTPYGTAKTRAAEILNEACEALDLEFVDIEFPNLFGEHGRPNYNSVTATFCASLAAGKMPEVKDDKVLRLLHAQDAADALLGDADALGRSFEISVSGLAEELAQMAETYDSGEIPDVSDANRRNLFNTYRSYVFEQRPVIELTRHADPRGAFFEIVRTHGGTGQSSFSTTVPGITRGDHFHRRKVERFTVLSGTGVIRLRKLFSLEVLEFPISGDAPVAIDMPTMWTHSVTNGGSGDLYMNFWTNDLFDPEDADTIPEEVQV